MSGQQGDSGTNFRYTFYAQDIRFGAGAVAQLGDIADACGWRRLMVCTSEGSRRRGQLALVEQALAGRQVVAYGAVRPHVPEAQVVEATDLAAVHEVDAVIGLGGGSAIGLAKAVSLAIEGLRTGRPARAAFPTDQPLVPVVAIPTTYAGSEVTPVYGVTRQEAGGSRKVTVKDAKVTPKVAIYDPALTVSLPAPVSAGTGINAVAHCIEALYSSEGNPLASAVALDGLRRLADALPRCLADGADLTARADMMTGAFLAGLALSSVAMGLHHGLCHVLGGTTGASHADANSVMLPHVMRFNADTASAPLARAGAALGVEVGDRPDREAAEAAARHVAQWVGQMGLPQRLRDIGVSRASLPQLAAMALANPSVQRNPRPVRDAAELIALLEAAW